MSRNWDFLGASGSQSLLDVLDQGVQLAMLAFKPRNPAVSDYNDSLN